MAPPPSRQFLLLDGDDTLWENNIYFEEAIEAFIDFLAHSSMTRAQVRAALDEIERINIGVRGYGSASLTLNLRETDERPAQRRLRQADNHHRLPLGGRNPQQPKKPPPDRAGAPALPAQRP